MTQVSTDDDSLNLTVDSRGSQGINVLFAKIYLNR